MEYQDFKKDFIERTLNIIQTYDGHNDVTLLINCFVGLLILPKEKYHESIPDIDIANDEHDWGITRDCIKQVNCECCGYRLRNIVRQMRNSVAHMKIQSKSKSGEIASIVFSDTRFTAEIPVGVLKQFVIKLAATVIS